MFSKKPLEFDTVTTRGGDSGQTSMMNGSREYKDHIMFSVIGEMDMLQSMIGYARVLAHDAIRDTFHLREIQADLWTAMGTLNVFKDDAVFDNIAHLKDADVDRIEKWQKGLMKSASIPQEFITPGDNEGPVGAYLHVVRTQVRKCERELVSWIRAPSTYGKPYQELYVVQKYLNRLSDYIFVVSRVT